MRKWVAVVVFGCSLALGQSASSPWKGDADFITKTTMHHQQGVEMAQMCTEKAVHPELKQLCEKMLTEQRDDNRKMASLDSTAASAGQESSTHHPADSEHMQMHEQGSMMMSQMQGMSGAQFEPMFLQHMRQHHEMAEGMASECAQHAQSADLKQLCVRMKNTQAEEREQMGQMLKQWYPDQASKAPESRSHQH